MTEHSLPSASRRRSQWLILAALMTGISLGLCFARLLPYEAWLWVALVAAVITGVCVSFAAEARDSD